MFEAVVSEEGNVRTIALRGECDLQLFPDVDELFSKSVDNGFKAVRIDLRGLTFIDSSGIRALLLAMRRSQRKAAKLTITPGPPEVMRVFELLGLKNAFPFEDGAS
jgi:anti-sigma B factor antagonist